MNAPTAVNLQRRQISRNAVFLSQMHLEFWAAHIQEFLQRKEGFLFESRLLFFKLPAETQQQQTKIWIHRHLSPFPLQAIPAGPFSSPGAVLPWVWIFSLNMWTHPRKVSLCWWRNVFILTGKQSWKKVSRMNSMNSRMTLKSCKYDFFLLVLRL